MLKTKNMHEMYPVRRRYPVRPMDATSSWRLPPATRSFLALSSFSVVLSWMECNTTFRFPLPETPLKAAMAVFSRRAKPLYRYLPGEEHDLDPWGGEASGRREGWLRPCFGFAVA